MEIAPMNKSLFPAALVHVARYTGCKDGEQQQVINWTRWFREACIMIMMIRLNAVLVLSLTNTAYSLTHKLSRHDTRRDAMRCAVRPIDRLISWRPRVHI